MESRINYLDSGKGAMAAMFGLTKYLAKSTIEAKLQHLIDMRISQINGCAFCLDMHSKDLRHEGETEQRIYLLNAWRETEVFTARERAALEWAESVTLLGEGHVPDEIFERAKKEFSEQELVDLTMVTIVINSWNRLNIAFRTPAGTYQPGQYAAMAS
jgi:AhpD family alkylhydroperoxidase